MITGYNTDLKHGEAVLHVQTEDKGVSNPFIESVIYVRGRVLATKRTGYAKLLEQGKTEKDVASMMEHQHRTILAAIKAGRFDAKIDEAGGVRAADRVDPAVATAPDHATETVRAPIAESSLLDVDETGPSLDQVILEYLATEAEHEQLVLVIDSTEAITAGRVNQVALRAYSSKSGFPIAGVQITVKMLSTVADPRTLIIAETDDVGVAELAVDVPTIDRGSAALIFSGASDLGRAEIKQLL